MITIYDAATTDFTSNGYGVLHASSATVTEELNGSYELALTIPAIDENSRILPYLQGFNIIKAPAPRGSQLFRIYNVNKNLRGDITVSARHIFYDLLYNQIANISGDGAVSAVVQSILNAAVYPHSFSISSDITSTITYEYINTNPVACLLSDGGVVDSLQGGELYRDNYTIKLQSAIGADRGLKIRYRKNLSGLDLEINHGDVVTRIKPVARAAEGESLYLPEVFIDSPNIGNYFMPLYGVLNLSEVQAGSDDYPETADAYAAMRTAAAAYFNEGNDLPLINAKINFVLLGKTAEYSEYAALEQIYLGDTVQAIHPDLNVSMTAKCIKYTYDAILQRYSSIELGDPRDDFTTTTSRELGQLNTVVFSSGSLTARVVALENLASSQGSTISSQGSSISTQNSALTALQSLMATHAHTGVDGTVKISSSNLTT